ncbi:hypothetical protein JL09_g2212 [Pichia kudriavzevii]|uniref:Protein BIM1 n=1 Tax=Pichia kudriavzevii TaxID=4909 RepID=A0A099P372_PICKU|nr:hypothetical protein JL09_g2212 [Pichia kudriavzevii]
MAIVGASKSELLDWINPSFAVNYTKIEQCGTGAIYCLIFDALYPNTINVSRVHRSPQSEFQTMSNYKLLQQGFNKAKITRNINVEKLTKCRLQDNLEFLQWFGKLWCDHHKDFSFSSSSSRQSSRPTSRRTTINTPKQSLERPLRSERLTKPDKNERSERAFPSTSRISEQNNKSVQYEKEMQLLSSQLQDMTNLKNGLEIERNFYFNKLRDIEILCQNISQTSNKENISTMQLISDIMDIMYTTEDGFLLPDEEENDDVEGQDSELPELSPQNHDRSNELLDQDTLDTIQTEKSLVTPNQTQTDHLFDDETF